MAKDHGHKDIFLYGTPPAVNFFASSNIPVAVPGIIAVTAIAVLVTDAVASFAVPGTGAVAAKAESNKITKCVHQNSIYLLVLMAVESCGNFGSHAQDFIKELGCLLKGATQEQNSYQYQFLWLCSRVMLLQCWSNTASVLE